MIASTHHLKTTAIRMKAALQLGALTTILKTATAFALIAMATAGISAQTAGSYQATNIISDGVVPATVVDSGFVDPRGISIGRDFRIDTAATGFSYANRTNGSISFKTVIPSASGSGTGKPTGTIFNTTSGFVLSNGSPADFLFASLDGSIWGWNGKLSSTGNISLKTVDNSASHAVYTDIALAPSAGGTVLLAANFGQAADVEAFDQSFKPIKLAGNFTEPNLPAGYAPYALHVISGQVYVTYTLRSTSTYLETLGPNTGFISVFDLNGNFVKRAITGGNLNAPWGMALAPSTFGVFGNALLVGNVGDGLINVYDAATYAFRGQITDSSGAPIFSKLPGAGSSNSYAGLSEILFGNGTATSNPSSALVGDNNTLYFAAGLSAQTHGLFGAIAALPATGGPSTFGFSLSSPSVTLTSGGSTSVTVAITPVNGFSGSVTFACAGLPVYSTCNFTSPTLGVTPAASATETMTISTAGGGGGRGYTAMLLPVGGMILLALSRKRIPRPTQLFFGIIGILAFAAALTGCGYSKPANTATPAGASQITITATSGAVTQSATMTIVVQ